MQNTSSQRPAGKLIVMPSGATRDAELRAAVLEIAGWTNPEMDGMRICETLKAVGFDLTQSELLSVLQHLHDHGYIVCEEKLRPLAPLSDLARLSRIEITPVGCGALGSIGPEVV
jgi:hypothetical protein